MQRAGVSGLKIFVGMVAYDTATAGALVVTGIGFKPKGLIAFAHQDNAVGEYSFGLTDGVTTWGMRSDYTLVPGSFALVADSISFDTEAAGKSSKLDFVSFDDDGFSVTKVKTGLPTGTQSVEYMAIG